ncbi:MAG: UDP-glucose--hexose-1-phosphate uridylyltransferase [Woeseia sp.]|nr:UDP-glucose--hexose-1-phosphate uridylyltransferase [Woeseia sp.]
MSQSFEFDKPHRRRNLLTGEWVLVSPHRTQRPWQGHEDTGAQAPPEYDETCYLCPGNERAGNVVNPDYDDVFVFDNDFPALLDDKAPVTESDAMFSMQPVCGCCRVICYGPRHDLALHRMDLASIQRVISAWKSESQTLSERYEWVQIFENRGSLMGASSPHPHGQIWAIDTLPTEAAREASHQSAYFADNGTRLLLDYLAAELDAKERIIHENEDWVALVPYWAIWPFESMIIPRRGVARLQELTEGEEKTLAGFLKGLLGKYDSLFDAPMSYSMGWHSAPSSRDANDYWQLHAHIYPPALRSATIPKFMVGFELLSEKQRDITAESAAARLRDSTV